MTSASKKYKLFSSASTTDSGKKPPCAFFTSPDGCRNGSSCRFAHHEESRPSPEIPEVGSVVSSEESSQGEIVRKKETKEEDTPLNIDMKTSSNDEQANPTDEKKKRRNRGKRSDNDLPFAKPKKKVKLSTTASTPSASDRQHPFKEAPEKAKKEPKPPTSAPRKADSKSSVVANLKSLDLPVAPFTMAATAQTSKPGQEDQTPEPSKQETAKPPSSSTTNDQHPLPKSTAAGRKWLMAVEKTRSHPRYKQSYDFEKFQLLDEQAGIGGKKAWIQAKPFGEWCASAPQVIAIDCEMCETQDPVSGQRDSRALCRISVVDVETNELLLDSLVKPSWPVKDYRTWINGISQEHLESVQFTLRHAQAFMMALCSEETVIIGHAVHNDLAAIRMEHHCVVDSACLFAVKDSPTAAVALRDLSASILKKVMPEKHDSVNDARTALACVTHYVEKNGKVDAIERSSSGRQSVYNQLFVHRIPKLCEESHLSRMFLLFTSVQPEEVDSIEFVGEVGKTHVHFRSARHANLAFDTLEGKAEPDATGRLQKKVYLRNGSYLRVRKMAFEKDRAAALKRSSTG